MNFLNPNKLLHHVDKFSEWIQTGDTSGPITVKIDLTNVCNHNCPGCIDFDLIENDNNHLKYEVFNDLLDGLAECGVKGINYTGGGEPTVHKAFDKIIRLTHDKGLATGLICNGSRFHKWPMEELLPMFDWIRVSLDSYDAETHIRSHGSSAKFGLTIDNLKILTDIKRKYGLSTTLGAGYITNQYADMDKNLHKFIEICKDVGLDYAQLRPSFGFMFDYKSISSDELMSLFEKAKSYEDETFKVIIDEGKYNKILSGKSACRSYGSCHAQSFKATSITAKGDVYVCCSLSGRQSGWIGNINKTKFSEIWKGDTRKKLLENLDVNKCPPLCVGDNLNEFLEEYRDNVPAHKNFL